VINKCLLKAYSHATFRSGLRLLNIETDSRNIMKQLSKNWLTENLIDLEYKQYVLLAYLEEVSRNFQDKHLYPALSDLIEHYRNLKLFRENSGQIFNSFKETLEGIDMKHFQLTYQKVVQNDIIMAELEQIVDFSIPRFESCLEKGREIYEYVEKHLSIDPVGLIPLNPDAGYLIIDLKRSKETRIYEYAITLFENSGERYRGIHTHLIRTVTSSPFLSPQSIKLELIRENTKLPNPATYHIHAEIEIPFEATCLPVAKRLLMKQLSS
jgi:hypothetical protein